MQNQNNIKSIDESVKQLQDKLSFSLKKARETINLRKDIPAKIKKKLIEATENIRKGVAEGDFSKIDEAMDAVNKANNG